MSKEVGPAEVTGSPALLREINCAKVFTALRGRPPQRLTELSVRTGLSRPTVAQAVTQLVEGGWAEYADEAGTDQTAAGRSRIGRPARLVRFRGRAGYVLGIDIGPHKILAVLADLNGEVVAKRRRDDQFAGSGEEVLAAVRQTITDLLGAARVRREDVWSVAVGTPGIVDKPSGAVRMAPSLPGWHGIRLAGALGRSLRCPVHVENDVNLAVIAERWRGVAVGVHTVVFVQWGARIGAGLIIGDRLHRGSGGMAGEIGYLSVFGEPDIASDEAGLGPLERLVGAAAISSAAGSRPGRPALRADRRPEELDAEAVFAAARTGDVAAAGAVDTVAQRLARGLSALLLLLDPDMVVLGGGVSAAGEPLLDAIRTHLRPLTFTEPVLALSVLGDEATALGAVRTALSDVERRVLPHAAQLPDLP
ncbi:ROK family transcriptional regulator [Rugosimonospora acidiphila]|uniref:ROK family transcriptional regulator n=1 Tax=Rugosimonospora acidiphila TaxID=556531 RepID=A0ABP9SSX2_9ACTN